MVLATCYSQGHRTDFDPRYATTRSSAQGCAFSGSQTQNLIFRLHFPELAPFPGSVVTIASEPASIDYDRSFEKNRDVDVDVDSMLHGHVD